MGIFDISMVNEVNEKSEEKDLMNSFPKKLEKYSSEKLKKVDTNIFLEKFKAENSFLSYNLTIDKERTKGKDYLYIDGELQNVWVFVIMIILSILLTKGIGILPIILFVYYQKRVNTKFIENILKDFI